MAGKTISDQLDNAGEIKDDWIQQFEKIGEAAVAEQLKKIEMEDVNNEETFQQLINVATDSTAEQHLQAMKENVEDILGVNTTTFDIQKYKDYNKTEIAIKMADYVVHTKNIRPVYIGPAGDDTDLYKYNPDTGTWNYFSSNKLGQLCKTLAKGEYSRHLETEFTRNVVNHPSSMNLNDMGTNEKWVVINNAKKMYLADLSDLKDMRIEDVKKSDQALHKINVDYEPEAECPEFKEFVYELFDQKEKQVQTLQEFLGWLLKYPDRSFKRALIILGVSNSGKSQLAEIVERIFSNENGKKVTNLSIPMLGAKRTFHLDKLERSILNIDKDMTGREIERTDLIKKLAAQESLAVEPKGEDAFTINPSAKFFICSNVAPQIKLDGDGAFHNRFLTLKAPNSVPREDRVKDLGQKIYNKEKEGIFNWMLEGLKRVENQGQFTLMPTADETKRMWYEFGDSISRFIWQVVDLTGDLDDDYIQKDDLYDHYEKWFEQNPDVTEKASRQRFKNEVSNKPEIESQRKPINGVRQQVFTGVDVDISQLNYKPDEFEDTRDEEEIDVEP